MGVINLPRLLAFFIYVFIGDGDVEDGQQIYDSLRVLWMHLSEIRRNNALLDENATFARETAGARAEDERYSQVVAERADNQGIARAMQPGFRTKAMRSARARSKERYDKNDKNDKKKKEGGGRKRRKTRKKRKRRKKNLKKRTKKRARRRKSKGKRRG
jgi:hypothetical protein